MSKQECLIIQLTASIENNCQYCIAAAHSMQSLHAGIDDEVVSALRSGAQIPDTRFAALANMVRQLHRQQGCGGRGPGGRVSGRRLWVVPGLLLTGAFMAFVLVWAIAKPQAAPRQTDYVSWAEKFGAARAIAPVLLLIGGVLGALYAGVATPTEAAAVGALGAFLLCAARGRLTWETVRVSLIDTAKVTSFLLFIIIGASILSYLFDFVRLATELVQAVEAAGLSPLITLAFIGLVYIVLGMFIDPISMMVMTLPVVYPLIIALGFDPIWFGIILVILIEIGLITPPVGMNLYVLQGVNPHARSRDIMIGALPFVAIMLLFILLLVAFPQIALWLPETVR